MSKFPKSIEDFGNAFVTMQIKRHEADYDPEERFKKSEVLQDIDNAELVIVEFIKAAVKDRRAFATYTLLRQPRA